MNSQSIVHDRRIDAGLNHRRHPAVVALGEALRPGAGLVVQIPVEAGGQHQPRRDLKAQRVDVGQEQQQTGQTLATLGDAEFRRLLDGVDGIAAGIGHADHLVARALSLQQERREVGVRERHLHAAHDLAAGAEHRIGGVAFQRVAEGIVGGEEVPLLRALADQSRAGAGGQRIGVIDIVDAGGRAGLL